MVSLNESGKVQFRFTGPSSGPVYVVGDFNDWDERANPMRREGDRTWRTDLKLREGDYRFLYRAGSSWYVDPESPNVPNPWGSEFSVITIPQQKS